MLLLDQYTLFIVSGGRYSRLLEHMQNGSLNGAVMYRNSIPVIVGNNMPRLITFCKDDNICKRDNVCKNDNIYKLTTFVKIN